VDYSALELATLSQVCIKLYGKSVMADKINDGADLHRYYASILYNKDESKVTKEERQAAKPASFGFAGGLGCKTFIQFAKGYNLYLNQEQAQNMKEKWFIAFPEMQQYLQGEQGFVYTLTGRKRANTTFCAEKNTPFQGLASDGLKLALYNLDKNGYEIVAEVHDQILIEASKEDSDSTLKKVQKIMEESMNKVVPDVKISTEGMVLDRWTK
jgi:DNA polymerase-1